MREKNVNGNREDRRGSPEWQKACRRVRDNNQKNTDGIRNRKNREEMVNYASGWLGAQRDRTHVTGRVSGFRDVGG